MGKQKSFVVIVIYTSDQGFFLGEHGLFDKRFMYEESLRIPFLVRYPREIKTGSVNKDIITNCDFAETFLDYACTAIPDDMQGRSLRPLLEGKTVSDWPQSMYYRYWMHRPHYNVSADYGVRTHQYNKLIFYYGLGLGAPGALDEPLPPEWELFDLEKDPHEMNNAGVGELATKQRYRGPCRQAGSVPVLSEKRFAVRLPGQSRQARRQRRIRWGRRAGIYRTDGHSRTKCCTNFQVDAPGQNILSGIEGELLDIYTDRGIF